MMKAYWKTVLRSVKNNIARLLSITLIMLLGISFVGGLGTISPTFKDSYSEQMNRDRFSDVIIKCKQTTGFSDEALELLENSPLVESFNTLTSVDFVEGKNRLRLCIYDDLKAEINKLALLEGRYPKNENEVLVERGSNRHTKYALNDKITLLGMPIEYTIVGIVGNPQIFDLNGEPFINTQTGKVQGSVNKLVYMQREQSMFPFLPTTDVHVRFAGFGERDYFSDDYLAKVNEGVEGLKTLLGEENYAFLTVESCKSYALFDNYCDKVSVITLIFPVFFVVVAALVVMTTMTRMVEEERPILGCLKSLGMQDGKILLKYLLLILISCFISAMGGLSIGFLVLPNVIYPAFETMFFLPVMSKNFYTLSGILASALMTTVVVVVTFFVCRNELREKPSELLKAKTPPSGKKILLEKIPFIWSRLSFKYKSSIRNVFRYKKHLFMTILSVAGGTALVFAGFGVLDVAVAMGAKGGSYVGLKDATGAVAAVVIIFALLLCVFVIYNLTNLNIGERKKEIATLGVLGYREQETLGYIYREIWMMSIVGIVIGIFLGMALLKFVLYYLEFGALSDVKWFTYLLSFVCVLVFVGVTDILLAPKILKIDMTTSLKSNE